MLKMRGNEAALAKHANHRPNEVDVLVAPSPHSSSTWRFDGQSVHWVFVEPIGGQEHDAVPGRAMMLKQGHGYATTERVTQQHARLYVRGLAGPAEDPSIDCRLEQGRFQGRGHSLIGRRGAPLVMAERDGKHRGFSGKQRCVGQHFLDGSTKPVKGHHHVVPSFSLLGIGRFPPCRPNPLPSPALMGPRRVLGLDIPSVPRRVG